MGKLCVLRGTSPRGDHGHVVVARACDTGHLGQVNSDRLASVRGLAVFHQVRLAAVLHEGGDGVL